MEVMQAVEEFVLGLAGSPWILLAVAVLATIDGFFPPVPSESVVITVAVLSVAGDGPSLWLLVLVAAVGAFCGDLIAYTIGSKVPIDDLRVFRGRRGRASLAWAARTLARNGTVFILSARFVPIGRVAVNMTAGAVGFPRRRFVLIAGIAALVWGTYSTLMGVGAGHILHEHPIIAVAVGVAGGVLAGFLVDRLLREAQRRWFPHVPPPEVRMHVAEREEAAEQAEAAEKADGAMEAADAPVEKATEGAATADAQAERATDGAATAHAQAEKADGVPQTAEPVPTGPAQHEAPAPAPGATGAVPGLAGAAPGAPETAAERGARAHPAAPQRPAGHASGSPGPA